MVQIAEYDHYLDTLASKVTTYETRLANVENAPPPPPQMMLEAAATINAIKLTLPTTVLVYYLAANRDVGIFAKILSFLVLVYTINLVAINRYVPMAYKK